jgi:hypothetical protein
MTHFYFILILESKTKGSEVMSQWILIALILLAHPLMMLFMHKGMMHGNSGSMNGCGNHTQQDSSNTEKPRKKVN